jgi:ribonuclease J
MLQPKFVIPAHGEYRYRREAKKVACSVGIPSENVLMVRNGDVIELGPDSCRVVDRIPLKEVLIDGYEKRSVAHGILEERRRLSESGIVVVEICIDKKSGRYASGVNVTSKGFVELERNPALKNSIQEAALSELSRFISQGVRDDRVGKGVSRAVRELICQETGKNPIVVALLTEVMV